VNPVDAMRKKKPNKYLANAIATNNCDTPPRKVFMLQTSAYRFLDWIPTSRVPMEKATSTTEDKQNDG